MTRLALALVWLGAALAVGSGVASGQDASPPATGQGVGPGDAAGASREIGGIAFVWCPPGTFQMGASMEPTALAKAFGGAPEWYGDETPQREVAFAAGFWLSSREVTRAQWRALMSTVPWSDDGEDSLPATQMTWEEARDFSREFGARNNCLARLPLEAEWEYACRAGSAEHFYFGPDPSQLELHAQYRFNAKGQVQQVGQRGANAWGLHDVLGNVWEWCQDKYAGGAGSRELPAAAAFRCIRGGAANSTAAFLRASYRVGMPVDTRSPRVGLRLLVEP